MEKILTTKDDMEEELAIPFSARLRAVRRARGLSQEKLALDAGISTCQISSYETDRCSPNIATLEWICKALKIKASDLLGF